MAPVCLSPLAWDCHVHCFDPEKFPFKPTKTYTPKPAQLSQLVNEIAADRIMLVQATVEDGPSGLLRHLETAQAKYHSKIFRGTIFADPEPTRNLGNVSHSEFDRMHELGVRSIRIHGSYGGSGDDVEWTHHQLLQAARLYPVKQKGWVISAQLPLKTWAGLSRRILHTRDGYDLSNVTIVADHNACAEPKDIGTTEVEAIIGLLKSGNFFIKLGALYRRAPEDFRQMRPLVELFASAAPHQLLWGSDWPHVDTTQKGSQRSTSVDVDVAEELRAVKSWLSQQQFDNLLVANPDRVFGS